MENYTIDQLIRASETIAINEAVESFGILLEKGVQLEYVIKVLGQMEAKLTKSIEHFTNSNGGWETCQARLQKFELPQLAKLVARLDYVRQQLAEVSAAKGDLDTLVDDFCKI